MKKKTVYIVTTGKQNPLINMLMKAAGFSDGVYVDDGSGYKMTVTWKSEKRIAAGKAFIRKVLQDNDIVPVDIRVEAHV